MGVTNKNAKQNKVLKNFKLRPELARALQIFAEKQGKTQTRIVEECLASRFAVKM